MLAKTVEPVRQGVRDDEHRLSSGTAVWSPKCGEMHPEDFKQGRVGASKCYVKKPPVGAGRRAGIQGLGWLSWTAVV